MLVDEVVEVDTVEVDVLLSLVDVVLLVEVVVGGRLVLVLLDVLVLDVLALDEVVVDTVLVVVPDGSTSICICFVALHTPSSRTRHSIHTQPAVGGVHRSGFVVPVAGAIHSTASGMRRFVSSARRAQARISAGDPATIG